jgi:hypothetical protein
MRFFFGQSQPAQSQAAALVPAAPVTDASTLKEQPKRGPLRRTVTISITNADGQVTKIEKTFTPLGNLFFGTTAAGLLASLTVTPVMTIIDLAIIKAQFEKTSVFQAIKNTPNVSLPSMGIMSYVYGGTYLTANWVEAGCKELGIDYKIPTAVCTSAVNCALIAWKDKEYAKLQNKAAAKFPAISYGMFAIRDGMTVTASFVLKNNVRDYLESEYQMKHRNADLLASFATPMVAQIFSTPFHILSLDIFSRPEVAWANRLANVAKNYFSVTSGRVFRIIPAFGIGGFINDTVKEALMYEDSFSNPRGKLAH